MFIVCLWQLLAGATDEGWGGGSSEAKVPDVAVESGITRKRGQHQPTMRVLEYLSICLSMVARDTQNKGSHHANQRAKTTKYKPTR